MQKKRKSGQVNHSRAEPLPDLWKRRGFVQFFIGLAAIGGAVVFTCVCALIAAWRPHLVNLAWRALSNLLSSVGNTGLGVSIFVFVSPILRALEVARQAHFNIADTRDFRTAAMDEMKKSVRAEVTVGAAILLVLFGWSLVKTTYEDHHDLAEKAKSLEQKLLISPVDLTSLHMGCEFDYLPLTIQPGTAISVMWLDPAILHGTLNLPGVGPFDEVFAPRGKVDMTWPTKQMGRWMTITERHKVIDTTHAMPVPVADRCVLTNYAATLDEVVARIIVDTSDKKRHTYSVHFNPLVAGHPFEFYMVSKCSSGVVPILAQWDDKVNVRIVGDSIRRIIPLKFDHKTFPSSIAGVNAVSAFAWNDRKDGCKWED